MGITRSEAERVLVNRCGALLTAADLDGITNDGTNDDLNDPIGVALRTLGYSVASVVRVVDSDLESLATSDLDKFLDVAEYRTLRTILGNLDDVDIESGPFSAKYSQLPRQLERRLMRLEEKLQIEYGLGGAELEMGAINMNFAMHGDDTVI